MTGSPERYHPRQSCYRVFLNCYSDLLTQFMFISTPIFLVIANCIRQFVHGANALEPLEGGLNFFTPLLKCSRFLLGSGSGRLGKHYKKHFSCSTRSLAFLPLKAVLSSLCHCYKLKLCEFLQRSWTKKSAGQKQIYQARHRIQSKLLGRFAPLHQCSTVLTNTLTLNQQPQPRTCGGTVSPP